MFKKKPNLKPLAPLRSSDRRKIAQQIIADLSYAPETGASEQELRNLLLPDGASAAKFNTTHGPALTPFNGTVYFGTHPDDADRPLWVRVDRGSPELFPTVYTLWKNPGLLPVLHTHGVVVERLFDGADLMTPGLVGPPFPEGAKVGRLVGVASTERPGVPVVVGVCEIDVAGLEKAVGEKGRAVRVLHWVGDEIYKHGTTPGKVPDTLEVPAKQEKPEENVVEGVEALSVADDNADSGEEEIRQLETKEIDEAFYNAALYGFYDYVKNDKVDTLEFPLSASLFISTLVHPYLPSAAHFPPHNYLQSSGPHPSLHLKKTSWKNTTKFIKYLSGKMLVATKVRSGGETVITDIAWDSAAIKSFTPYRLPSESTNTSAPSSSAPEKTGTIKIEALFRPHGRNIKLFEAFGVNAKDYYTPAELKGFLATYIITNALENPANKRIIKLDPLLSNTLFSSSASDSAELAKAKGAFKRDLLADRLVSSCAPYHRITTPSGEVSKPKSGNPPKVEVIIEKRQGRKMVTIVRGVEAFGVDPKALAEELQKVCAGSSTVGQAMGAKPGLMEVMVQGSQKAAVEKALEKRGVSGKWVSVLDKSGGKK